MTHDDLALHIERYLQGGLEAGDRFALEEILRRDADARARFECQVRLDLQMDAALRPVTEAEARRCASLAVGAVAPSGSRLLRAIGRRLGIALPGASRARRWRRRLGLGLAAAAVPVALVAGWLLTRPTTPGYGLLAGGIPIVRGVSVTAYEDPVRLDLGGYCRLRLEPAGTLLVEGREGAEQVRLDRGRLACDVDRHVGSFLVRTRLGTVRVEGTRFEARLADDGAAGRRLEVAVSEGAVHLSGLFVERLIGAGETGSIHPGEDNRLETTRGFILGWRSAGPYAVPGREARELFDVRFPPEQPGGVEGAWAPVAAGIGDWDIDLHAALGQRYNVAAYLRTHVWSPVAQDVRLELGSDDAIKVWLNGTLVHANNADRALGPRQDTADARLRAGWNDLRLKVTNHDGPWGFGCRIVRRDGGDVVGLHVDAR